MIRTHCCRLSLNNKESALLASFGAVYASVKHAAFKRVHVLGEDENETRKALQKEFDLPYRIVNSAIYDAKQAVAAHYGLLEWRVIDVGERIRSIETGLEKLGDKTSAKQRKKAHYLRRDLDRERAVLERVKRDLNDPVPKICFGGRELLRNKSLVAWGFRRKSNILFVGKGQDKGGNGMATWDPLAQTLRIRLPDSVGAGGEDRWLVVKGVKMGKGESDLARALALGLPITWRIFHRDGAWRAHATVDLPPAETLTRRRAGMIGVDLNVDHVAVTVTTPDGNIRRVFSLPFPPHGTPRGLAREMIANAVKRIASLALHLGVPVAAEDLDFQRKKSGLRKVSVEHRKRLSSFAYSAFAAALDSRCGKLGVEVIRVNPAYSSVVGREKYARGRGLSAHHAAALVIARAAQGFTERAVSMSGGRVGSSVRKTRPGPAPANPRVRVVGAGSRKARKPAPKRDRPLRGVTHPPSEEALVNAMSVNGVGIGERSGVETEAVTGLNGGQEGNPPLSTGQAPWISDLSTSKDLTTSV